MLDGTSTERLVPAELMRDDACPLGQWLLGAGREHFGQATAFQAVDRAHEKFHLEAGRVLTMAQSGQKDAARKQLEFGDYAMASQRLRADLTALYVDLTSGQLAPK